MQFFLKKEGVLSVMNPVLFFYKLIVLLLAFPLFLLKILCVDNIWIDLLLELGKFVLLTINKPSLTESKPKIFTLIMCFSSIKLDVKTHTISAYCLSQNLLLLSKPTKNT